MTTPASVRAPGDLCRYGLPTGSWPPGMPPDGCFYRRLAADVERHGFDLLFDGDHLCMHNPNPDPLAILGTYAGATERVLLGTGALLPALRAPVVMPKQLATIDYVSGGHLIVGVDVGGEIEQEWRAMEIPRERRGARTDEALALLRAFWSTEELAFDGQFRRVHGVTSSPRRLVRLQRVDRPGRRRIDTIAHLRDHDMDDYRISYEIFTYVSDSHEHARTMAGRVREALRHEFDHLFDAFCAVGTPDHVAERSQQFRDAGVHDFLLVPLCPWSSTPSRSSGWPPSSTPTRPGPRDGRRARAQPGA